LRTFRILLGAVVSLLASSLVTRLDAQGRWVAAKCDLKPGHYLVNSGQLYLKSATEAKFDEQRQKDLRDANRVLNQALTSGGQEKNPAAWYYLGRYYLLTNDLSGADTAFNRAQTLKPDCKNDIAGWRQLTWMPTLNAGITAWQAGNTDSAMKAFRAANAMNQDDPRGFKYLATLLYQTGQADSAIYYFRRAAEVSAKDPKLTQERKDALYNMSRIQHSQARREQDSISKIKADSVSPRWAETQASYREYLGLYPNDAEILASYGSTMMQLGKRDSAFAIYNQIISRADSMGPVPLLQVGAEIYQSVPQEPDSAAVYAGCRTEARAAKPVPTAARIRARCDSVTNKALRDYRATSAEAYKLSAKSFEESARLNPYYRDALFNLANTYLVLGDTGKMLPVVQRLVAVDPLNRQSLRLMAFAHSNKGHTDSTIYYLRMADSTLVTDVSMTGFETDSAGAQLKGLIQNLRQSPTTPMKLVFEFVNQKGDVVATQTVDVPAIPAGQGQPFEVKPTGAGIIAWRYHKA
jgi:tetratricopeptide (TPR) repeat protein